MLSYKNLSVADLVLIEHTPQHFCFYHPNVGQYGLYLSQFVAVNLVTALRIDKFGTKQRSD
jgi:hypothetical protein